MRATENLDSILFDLAQFGIDGIVGTPTFDTGKNLNGEDVTSMYLEYSNDDKFPEDFMGFENLQFDEGWEFIEIEQYSIGLYRAIYHYLPKD